MDPINLRVEDLPSDDNCDFARDLGTLPTPTDVRTRARQNPDGDLTNHFRPPPVLFPERNLLVKWGPDICIAEGQCLWFLNHPLREQVPVLRIYAWRTDANQVFLYMELIQGDPLSKRWDALQDPDRQRICTQLRAAILSWRRIQPPNPTTISHINGQGIREIMFQDNGHYPAGPFRDVRSFHIAYARLAARRNFSEDPRPDYEEMAGLSDDVPVVFTHNDLDLSNLLISRLGDGEPRLVGVVDWHQSGWFPEPWEGLKARSIANLHPTWRDEYVPLLTPEPDFGYRYAWVYICMGTI